VTGKTKKQKKKQKKNKTKKGKEEKRGRKKKQARCMLDGLLNGPLCVVRFLFIGTGTPFNGHHIFFSFLFSLFFLSLSLI